MIYRSRVVTVVAALASAACVNAVTIYTTLTVDPFGNALPEPTGTFALPPPVVTLGAYNLTTLTPPAVPNPLPPTTYTAQLYAGKILSAHVP